MKTFFNVAVVALMGALDAPACSYFCPENTPEPDSRSLGNILRDKALLSAAVFIGTYDSTVAYVSEPRFDPDVGEDFTETRFYFHFTVHRQIKGSAPGIFNWEKGDRVLRKYESVQLVWANTCETLSGEDFFQGKPLLIFSDYANGDANPGFGLPVCSDFRRSRSWFEVQDNLVIYNPKTEPGEAPESYSLNAFVQNAATTVSVNRTIPQRAGFNPVSLPGGPWISIRRLDGRLAQPFKTR